MDLLRETGQAERALRLFEEGTKARLATETRRELLDLYREAGRIEEMLAAYAGLCRSEPRRLAWPEGWSRYLLEQGEREEARRVWEAWLAAVEPGPRLLEAAGRLRDQGFDELARECAGRCLRAGREEAAARLFLFDLERSRGRLEAARAALEDMEAALPPAHAARMDLAEAWERLGDLEAAVRVLMELRRALGGELAEDLEMRLAWLLSQVGREEEALELWKGLWRRVASVPRRRYVEDRMMAVASRLGVLADLAIELEERLYAGQADDREAGLLVRLYTRVGDPVSAAEILDEHLEQGGGDRLETLQEKARVYLACTDYHHYEETVEELIRLDPGGEAEYLQQIAMSMLERGRPEEAREVLRRLREVDRGEASWEFEAGVLALAGLTDEAVAAYRRGLAARPDRIESLLLLANLLRESGQRGRAIGMFQYLAEHAGQDDLFTVAVDGLLNLEAPEPVLRHARRLVLERLAARHDRIYLYQLLADLSEQLDDLEGRFAALDNSLPLAGDRRPALLREAMDLARGGQANVFGRPQKAQDPARHLEYGRRLVGLNQAVPPQVFLDLAGAFLEAGDVRAALRTFDRARGLPDRQAFLRRTASLLEEYRYLEAARDTWRRVLVSASADPGVLLKAGEIEEQLGDDAAARGYYEHALDILLGRQPLTASLEEEADPADPWNWGGDRNRDDFDRWFYRLRTGLLATLPPAEARRWWAEQKERLGEELRAVLESGEAPPSLARCPRILRRAALMRRVAFAAGLGAEADALDRELRRAFPEDAAFLAAAVRERLQRGRFQSARGLLAEAPEDGAFLTLRLQAGLPAPPAPAGEPVPFEEAFQGLVPLLVEGRREEARSLLRRADLRALQPEQQGDLKAVLSAAAALEDPGLTLKVARAWLRRLVETRPGAASWQIRQLLPLLRQALPQDLRLSLYQDLMDRVLEEPGKRGSVLQVLPALQEDIGRPLLERDALFELVQEQAGRMAFELGPLLRLLPEEDRAPVLRSAADQIPATLRAIAALRLLKGFDEPLGPEFEEVVVATFASSLDEAQESYLWELLSLPSMESGRIHARTVLRFLEAAREANPDDPLFEALELIFRGREEGAGEALVRRAAEVALRELPSDTTDYPPRQVRSLLFEEFLSKAPEAFERVWDELDQEGAPDMGRMRERLRLVTRTGAPEIRLRTLERAVELFPDEASFGRQYRTALQAAGRSGEALAHLRQALERQPEDARLARELWDVLRRRGDWRGALEAWKAWNRPESGPEAAAGSSPKGEEALSAVPLVASGASPALFLPAGNGTAGAGAAAGGEEEEDGRLPEPRPERVRRFLEEGDAEAARAELRRLWRVFPAGEGSGRPGVFVVGLGALVNGRPWSWPEEPEETAPAEEELEAPPEPKGGLLEYREWKPSEPKERKDLWTGVAGTEPGRAEIEARLRVAEAAELPMLEPFLKARVEALLAEHSLAEALEAALEQARSADADQIALAELLELLERAPAELVRNIEPVLRDLERSLHPRDGQRILRLARAWAAAGNRERAASWFRWAAVLVDPGGGMIVIGQPGADWPPLSLPVLVEAVRAAFGSGEEAVALLEEILGRLRPGGASWNRQQTEQILLDTWTDLVGPREALPRVEMLCATADARDQPLRRGTALRAAWIYAAAGEAERARSCLETALCTFPAGSFPSEFGWSGADQPGSLQAMWLARLFPADASDFTDPEPVWTALGEGLLSWMEEKRYPVERGVLPAALAVWRLAEAGERETAAALVRRLAALEIPGPRSWLRVLDAARSAGEEELARGVEEFLLARGALPAGRVPEVLERVWREAGPDLALALGEAARQSTPTPRVLEELARAAEARGDEAAARRLRKEAAESLAAWRELRRLQKEQAEREREAQRQAAAS